MVKSRSSERIGSKTSQDSLAGLTNMAAEEEEFDDGIYCCTGNFAADIYELCRRLEPPMNIPVKPRPTGQQGPVSVTTGSEERVKSVKSANKPPSAPPSLTRVTPATPSNIMTDTQPKTYTVNDNFLSYFSPSIQVVLDAPDDPSTVSEVYVRGWKVDQLMMNIFGLCFKSMTVLHTLNLWRAGLTYDTVCQLSGILADVPTVRTLVLDNNPVCPEPWHLLLCEPTHIQHLSLRYNQLSDDGARQLGCVIGDVHRPNDKLLSLNLTGNRLTNHGAAYIARGLRWNRSLVWLNLSSNQIGDTGVSSLAQVLTRFPLMHEEVVARRSMTSLRNESALLAAKKSEEGRPVSVRSSSASLSKGKSGQHSATKTKRDSRQEKEEEKAKGKSKTSEKSLKKSSSSSLSRRSDKSPKGKRGVQDKPPLDTTKAPECSEPADPLLDVANHNETGELVIKGNLSLAALDLSNNLITDLGLCALQCALCCQATMLEEGAACKGETGLLRLNIERNKGVVDEVLLNDVRNAIQSKDPIAKQAPSSQ